jgi:hypothetical protein
MVCILLNDCTAAKIAEDALRIDNRELHHPAPADGSMLVLIADAC